MNILRNLLPTNDRLTLAIISLALTVLGVGFFAPVHKASALSGSDFNAGNIIDDAVFYNDNAMTVSQIQSFLNARMPDCDTDGSKPYAGTTRAVYGTSRGYPPPYVCLKNYSQNIPTITNGGSDLCKNSISGGNKSAARILHDVGKACGINPQVLIVMLQKEMSLVTDDWPWTSQYDKAMGYACPDSGPNNSANCDSAYFGFFNQVYNAAKAYRRYEANPAWYNYRAGRNNTILWHPNTSCGTSNVFIENQATASLYIYTPYRPNSAALNNLYGTGNSCSSYGNRNFWRMFNDWFGSTSGSPFFRLENGSAIYMVGADNTYYHVPTNSALEAYGYWRTVNKIQVVDSSYLNGKVFSGKLSNVAQYEGDEIYIVNSGKRHHIPNLSTLNAYGPPKVSQLPLGFKYLLIEPDEKASTVFKKPDETKLFAIDKGKKRHLTSLAYKTQGNPVYNTRPTATYSHFFVDSLQEGAPLLAEGETAHNSSTGNVSVFNDGELRYASSNSIGQSWGLKISYVAPDNLLSQLPLGPTIGRYVENSSGSRFLIDNGVKLSYNSDLGMGGKDYTIVPERFLQSFSSVSFNNGTVQANNGSAIYKLSNGELIRINSAFDFVNLGYEWSKVLKLSDSLMLTFENEAAVAFTDTRLLQLTGQPEVYLLDESSSVIKRVSSLAQLSSYGRGMNEVIQINTASFNQYTRGSDLTNLVSNGSNYWVIDSGKKIRVMGTTLDNNHFNFDFSNSSELSSANINRFTERSGSLTELIRSDSSGKVYRVESGYKRWFAGKKAFEQNGGDWSKVITLSDYFINSIPEGNTIE